MHPRIRQTTQQSTCGKAHSRSASIRRGGTTLLLRYPTQNSTLLRQRTREGGRTRRARIRTRTRPHQLPYPTLASSHSNLIATEFAVSKSPYANQTPLLHIVYSSYKAVAHHNVSDRRSHHNHSTYIAASANYLQRPSCHLPRCRSSKPQ